MSDRIPTCKQLERDLSHKIQALYNTEIKYLPSITCKLFSRYIAIITDEALTPLENSLWQQGQTDLIQQVHREIALILRPKLIKVVENIIGVPTVEILGDLSFSSNKGGILVILSESPKVRSSRSLPKIIIS